MFIEAILLAGAVALCSLVGVFFFGSDRRLEGVERFVVPTAVGVFLSLVLFELVPETLHGNETWGGLAIAGGFIIFYVLSYELHRYFHARETDDRHCDRKGAATLVLVGDAIHNFADGIILGGAFLLDPALGTIVAIGLALHEIPQEIMEFGVLIRGGYSRFEAAWRNLLSASSIILGTAFTMSLGATLEEHVWIINGIAAGSLLYIAATDLLPRVHGNLKNYRGFWFTLLALIIGFVAMTSIVFYSHEQFGHGHDTGEGHAESEEI